MNNATSQIVTKFWDFVHVLRNDGLSYMAISEHSAAVKGLQQTAKQMLYCLAEEKDAAKEMVRAMEAQG